MHGNMGAWFVPVTWLASQHRLALPVDNRRVAQPAAAAQLPLPRLGCCVALAAVLGLWKRPHAVEHRACHDQLAVP